MRDVDYSVVDNVKNLRINTRYIARGTTATCYKTRDGRMLKLFRNTSRKIMLFRCTKDIDEHFSYLNSLNNASYIGPDELVKNCKDELVAYYMRYRNARTIKRFRRNVRIRDLIRPYNKLILDTKSVSEARFRLSDVHDENILYDGEFVIIDLDHGKIDEYHNSDEILQYNMCDIVHTIIDAMFGVNYFKDIYFDNYKLDELYDELTKENYQLFEEFISMLEDELEVENPTIGYLRRNRGRILTLQKREDYYGRYM